MSARVFVGNLLGSAGLWALDLWGRPSARQAARNAAPVVAAIPAQRDPFEDEIRRELDDLYLATQVARWRADGRRGA